MNLNAGRTSTKENLIMIALLLLLALACLSPVHANAEDGFYVTGEIGQSRFSLTTPDGTWRQEGFGYHATKQSLAWSAGVGYGWEHWAVELGYLDFGRVSSGGYATGDADYNPTTKAVRPGAAESQFNATDATQAGVFKVKRSFDVWGLSPFLEAGGFVGLHHLNFWTRNSCGVVQNVGGPTFQGLVAGPMVGGGICYSMGYASVCGQVEYYRAISQSGFPISTEIILPTAGVQIPLRWY